MELIINNHIITSDIIDILNTIRELSRYHFLKEIRDKSDNISITCPWHKEGQENHPSCFVYNIKDNESVEYGWVRCFTCGEQGPLYKLVEYCLDMTEQEAKQWLVDNFSDTFVEYTIDLPEITFGVDDTCGKEVNYLDESILDKYAFYHPYMFKRGLTKEVINKFKIGYNKETNSITFPIWDIRSNLIGVCERRVDTKYFYIPKDMNKPVYLLNYIINENIKEVIVCESQINALTCWSWGMPAVALIGTGSKSQYPLLEKSGILIYHLALDGDLAGRHGILRFIKSMPDNVLIDIIQIPKGKDVNDFTKEEFLRLPKIDKNNFQKLFIF